jgi:DNA-directed RNA polymerase subunit M/transcription elongation factor TFIIS
MVFMEGFDKYANVWCRKCGGGDTVQGRRSVNRVEVFDITSIDYSDLEWADEIQEEAVNTVYVCTTCGNKGTDINEVATQSQNEAHTIFKEFRLGGEPTNLPKQVEEAHKDKGDDGYISDYEYGEE